MKIKRYIVTPLDEGGVQASESPDGAFVMAEDADRLERDLRAARRKVEVWDRRWKHWEGDGCACVFEEDGATLKGSMCNAHKELFTEYAGGLASLWREWLETEMDPEDEEFQPWFDDFAARVHAALAQAPEGAHTDHAPFVVEPSCPTCMKSLAAYDARVGTRKYPGSVEPTHDATESVLVETSGSAGLGPQAAPGERLIEAARSIVTAYESQTDDISTRDLDELRRGLREHEREIHLQPPRELLREALDCLWPREGEGQGEWSLRRRCLVDRIAAAGESFEPSGERHALENESLRAYNEGVKK